jgi:hypothetical protein
MLHCSACTIAVEAATSRCKLAAIGELRSGEFAKLPSIGSTLLAADLTWSNAAVLYMYRCDTSIVEGTLQASNDPELATILTDQFIGPGGYMLNLVWGLWNTAANVTQLEQRSECSHGDSAS